MQQQIIEIQEQRPQRSPLATAFYAEWTACRVHCRLGEKEITAAANCARKAGLLLPSDWRSVQAELNLPEQAFQLCLHFARLHPEPINDATVAVRLFNDARMVTGLLPFPDGHGEQQLYPPNLLSTVTQQGTMMISNWTKQLRRNPIVNWSQPYTEQFIDQVEHIMAALTAILEEAKAHADKFIGAR